MSFSSPTSPALVCANHRFRKTNLRCNKCNRPVCKACVELTPVGYRCKQCVQKSQYTFETVQGQDYAKAFGASAVISVIAGGLLVALVVTVIFAPFIGGIIAEQVHRAVQRRRGRYLPWVAVGGACAGGMAAFAVSALWIRIGAITLNNFSDIVLFLWPAVYMMACSVGLYHRLRRLERE